MTEPIRTDLLTLACRHLVLAEAAFAAGRAAEAERHLRNFYAISETPLSP